MYSESLFFGLRPDPEAIRKIQSTFDDLVRAHGLGGKMVAEATLHSTLCFVGRPERLPATPVPDLLQVGASVRAAPFDVVLDRAAGFAGGSRRFPNVLLFAEASARAATRLHEAIIEQLHRHGFAVPADETFTPHVTLSRSTTHWAHSDAIAPIRWRAREFALIQSIYDGVRQHRLLGRWPLRG